MSYGVRLCCFIEATGSGTWRGKTYYWEFSERFGPTFTTKKGEPCRTQPLSGGAWKAFNAWYEDYKNQPAKAHADPCCAGEHP